MCGRFALTEVPEEFLDLIPPDWPPLRPRYNIAPTDGALVVLSEKRAVPEAAMLRWGLVPRWARDASMGVRAINARAETVAEKPTFREAFAKRRCLVPATGFYEWRSAGPKAPKTPFYFSSARKGRALVLAGLWESWRGDGIELRTFAILTTSANQTMRPIHDRMPVILDAADRDRWLDVDADPDSLHALLRPAPNDLLEPRQVGGYVNKPGNEGERCVAGAMEAS